MSSGQAPLLMLDLATSTIRDRRRAVRDLAPRSALLGRRTRRAQKAGARADR
jgi:hypothetical protein